MLVRARGKEQRGGVQLRRLAQAMANSSCRELGRGFVPALCEVLGTATVIAKHVQKAPKTSLAGTDTGSDPVKA